MVEDTAVSSTIIRYVLNLNAEITATRSLLYALEPFLTRNQLVITSLVHLTSSLLLSSNRVVVFTPDLSITRV